MRADLIFPQNTAPTAPAASSNLPTPEKTADFGQHLAAIPSVTEDQTTTTRTYKRITHDRMGGTIPVWETTSTTIAANSATDDAATTHNNVTNALNTANQNTPADNNDFGFKDLIDIVNPLHHIPLVGSAYRTLTGDTIKESSKLFGSAAYGGPIGAVGQLATIIWNYETNQPLPTETAFSNSLQHQDSALNNTLLSYADLTKAERPNFYTKQTSDYND